jgi:thymidylate synthase
MRTQFAEESVDDLVRVVLEAILADGMRIEPTKGAAIELQGASLELRNPLARLSRTESRGRLFSSLGELCWYLAGSDSEDFIGYYLSKYEESAEKGVVPGAYGPRLFGGADGTSQVATITELLRRKPSTRRAVAQLFDARDLRGTSIDVPCTCTLQFMIRSGSLHMIVYMRSNDVVLGLTHDVFAFTMLQELLARSLGVELGTYRHFVGSLHLYETRIATARQFLEEGWQSLSTTMPPMPDGDPWQSVRMLINAERALRLNTGSPADIESLDPYWQDLVRLLAIFNHFRAKQPDGIRHVKELMVSDVYDPYIDEKLKHLDS